jgi:predicted glutamine amidotransferase
VLQDVINNGRIQKAEEVIEEHIKQHLSDDSKDLFELCKDNIKNYKTVKEEWGL